MPSCARAGDGVLKQEVEPLWWVAREARILRYCLKKKLVARVRKIGMRPFNGYLEITKEENKLLGRMTMREARIQTEILLRATKWMELKLGELLNAQKFL